MFIKTKKCEQLLQFWRCSNTWLLYGCTAILVNSLTLLMRSFTYSCQREIVYKFAPLFWNFFLDNFFVLYGFSCCYHLILIYPSIFYVFPHSFISHPPTTSLTYIGVDYSNYIREYLQNLSRSLIFRKKLNCPSFSSWVVRKALTFILMLYTVCEAKLFFFLLSGAYKCNLYTKCVISNTKLPILKRSEFFEGAFTATRKRNADLEKICIVFNSLNREIGYLNFSEMGGELHILQWKGCSTLINKNFYSDYSSNIDPQTYTKSYSLCKTATLSYPLAVELFCSSSASLRGRGISVNTLDKSKLWTDCIKTWSVVSCLLWCLVCFDFFPTICAEVLVISNKWCSSFKCRGVLYKTSYREVNSWTQNLFFYNSKSKLTFALNELVKYYYNLCFVLFGTKGYKVVMSQYHNGARLDQSNLLNSFNPLLHYCCIQYLIRYCFLGLHYDNYNRFVLTYFPLDVDYTDCSDLADSGNVDDTELLSLYRIWFRRESIQSCCVFMHSSCKVAIRYLFCILLQATYRSSDYSLAINEFKWLTISKINIFSWVSNYLWEYCEKLNSQTSQTPSMVNRLIYNNLVWKTYAVFYKPSWTNVVFPFVYSEQLSCFLICFLTFSRIGLFSTLLSLYNGLEVSKLNFSFFLCDHRKIQSYKIYLSSLRLPYIAIRTKFLSEFNEKVQTSSYLNFWLESSVWGEYSIPITSYTVSSLQKQIRYDLYCLFSNRLIIGDIQKKWLSYIVLAHKRGLSTLSYLVVLYFKICIVGFSKFSNGVVVYSQTILKKWSGMIPIRQQIKFCLWHWWFISSQLDTIGDISTIEHSINFLRVDRGMVNLLFFDYQTSRMLDEIKQFNLKFELKSRNLYGFSPFNYLRFSSKFNNSIWTAIVGQGISFHAVTANYHFVSKIQIFLNKNYWLVYFLYIRYLQRVGISFCSIVDLYSCVHDKYLISSEWLSISTLLAIQHDTNMSGRLIIGVQLLDYCASLTSIFTNTVWLEREICEFSNLYFIGNRDKRKLLTNYTLSNSQHIN